MKTWIKENLMISGKLVSKRCTESWFNKNNVVEKYNQIVSTTSFLPNPTFPQRIWHIIHDQYQTQKCSNPICDKSPNFLFFTNGYLRACCNKCAQLDPATSQKIKTTNLKRYGSEYGLSNRDVIDKRKQTLLKNYGVDNPTKSPEIMKKISDSNERNFGMKWILSDQKKKEAAVFEKYGVKNIQQCPIIKQQTIQTRRGMFFDSLATTDRLKKMATPLFSREEYLANGLYQKYKFRCNECNAEFLDCLEDGDLPRCPKCFKQRSFFEEEVLKFIHELLPPGEPVLENDISHLTNKKELDIYIPSKKLAIECDGLYWHGETGGNKSKLYHLDKTRECQTLGITLLHIFEDEWTEKKDIVKSKLKHLLGLNTAQKIFARKCKIRELRNSEKKLFLTENHVQGNDVAAIALGLFLTGQLVAVLTMCPRRIFTNPGDKVKGEYELSRYAALKDCSVIGGASKLLAHFIKQHKPKKIISYADRRWSMGKLYTQLGFVKVSDGTPNYWYFGQGTEYKRHHRFGFAKHTLAKRLANFDSKLTEWENMKNHGYDRIWDCGSFRYEMTF